MNNKFIDLKEIIGPSLKDLEFNKRFEEKKVIDS